MKCSMQQIPAAKATIALLTLVVLGGPAIAYEQYSLNGGDATNCGACHGDFRSNLYFSLVDGTLWGNLHNIHRMDMLNGDCDTCHGDLDRFPVMLNSSVGGDGLEPISCAGCHGRAEDYTEGNPDWPESGYAAGLRQHHFNAGVILCTDCHDDANPGNFTPTGEATLPPYYANPGNNHPNIPTNSCNPEGSEDFAGELTGLDNDGNSQYDGDDPDCSSTSVPEAGALRIMLVENRPNPFNPETVIHYTLGRPGHVRLSVYSQTGKLVRTLVDGYHDKADNYSTHWRGTDASDRAVASGVYFARLESSGLVETRRMVLLQ